MLVYQRVSIIKQPMTTRFIHAWPSCLRNAAEVGDGLQIQGTWTQGMARLQGGTMIEHMIIYH